MPPNAASIDFTDITLDLKYTAGGNARSISSLSITLKLIFRWRHLKVDKKGNNRTEYPMPAVQSMRDSR